MAKETEVVNNKNGVKGKSTVFVDQQGARYYLFENDSSSELALRYIFTRNPQEMELKPVVIPDDCDVVFALGTPLVQCRD